MRHSLTALALLFAAPAFGQTYNWIGGQGSPANDNWSTPTNWSPLGPPVPGSSVIIDRLNLPLGTGPIVDVDVSVASLIARNGGFFGGYESQNVHSLNVTGSTTLGPNAGLISCSEGCTYTLGTFLNQSNATLLYGATLGAGNNIFSGPGPAIIQWRGANLVRNEAGIGLNPNAVLRDQDTHLDALRSFAQNAGVFGVGGHTYVTPGAFTNFGLIQVVINANQRPFSRMVINGNFVNFDAGSGVLNGGAIEVKGRYGGRAEFAFPGADIRTLAPGSAIRLEGDAAVLDSLTGANGLRNLGNLGGEFSVANALGLTPTNGVLQHTNGTLNVLTNGILTVTGDFQQYTAATVNVGRAGAGAARLVITGSAAVMGNFRFDGVGTGGANDSVVETQQLTTGTDNFISGAGTIRVNPIPEPQPLILIDCRVLPGALPNVGPRPARAKGEDAAPARPRFEALPGGFPAPDEAPETIESTSVVPGQIRMEGAAMLSGSAKLLIGIAGLGAGVGHSVLTQVGAGGLQLDGQLSVTLAAGSTPNPVDTFEVVRSDALAGQFTNAADGTRLATTDGRGSFRVSYSSESVVLSDFELSDFTVFVGKDPTDQSAWNKPLNWSNGVPGVNVAKAVVPFDSYSAPAENYPGLDVLVLRARTATVLQGSPTLEFANGITLEADSSGGASLSHAGAGTARLATNRLALATSAGLGQMSSVAYVNAGLAVRQPGTAPAPMVVTTPPQGYFALDADVTPFRGSTLTFDARGNPQTISGSLILLSGAISEVAPNPPSASGASVVVQGAGATVMAGPGTYTGGTTVRESIFVFGAGFANFSGGLYAENATGSATGPGPVLVTSTAGASAGFDNRGLLSGNGTVAGNVTIVGGILQPGNSVRFGTPVGTLTLGGNLTFTTGPGFGGTRAGEFPVDLDPQNALAALRQDVLSLVSPTATVALGGAQLGITLQSPPSPGQTFRVLTAPNSPNAVSGTFAGLAAGASVSTTYFDVPFSFVVTYGANFVQLAHQTPPTTSYAYRRLFWFTQNELFDAAISGPLADPFGRGVSNLLAYALGEDPHTFRFDRLPHASTRSVAGTPYGVIEIRRALPLRPDLQYFVAESTGLAAGFGTPFDIDAAANAMRIVSRTNNGDGTETVVVRASAPISAAPHRFLRFSVQLAP